LVPDFEKQTLRVRLFNKKITTFDIGTEQMLEFQNLFEITVNFCVNCVAFNLDGDYSPEGRKVWLPSPNGTHTSLV
jgi:hypothetical protein